MDDDKMTDATLSTLKQLRTSAPSAEAKKLALNAAMIAFDAAQVRKPEPVKTGWLNRWKIGAGLGVPLGTAVAALVLLPLGTQMYTATSRHADGVPPRGDLTVASLDAPKTEAALPQNNGLATSDDAKLKDAPTLWEAADIARTLERLGTNEAYPIMASVLSRFALSTWPKAPRGWQ